MHNADLLDLHRLLSEFESHLIGGAAFRVYDGDDDEIQTIREVSKMVEREARRV